MAGRPPDAVHRSGDAVAAHPPRRRLPTIERAIAVMDACPDQPHTIGSLAGTVGVSVRTLQQAFRRHLGVTPMAYLRQVRLTRTHDDLCHGRAGTVAEAAHRWGFTHLGRFAAAYRRAYGQPPSRTLRHT